MKRNVFKILSFTVILAFLMPAIANAQGGKVNFAGNWVLNAQKSDMGQPPQGGNAQPQGGGQGGGMRGFGGGPLAVTQEANLLTVETSRTNSETGETTKTTMKYTLDGKESINTSARGDSKSVASWSADGKSLTIVTTRNFNGNDVTTKAVWTLGEGNALAVTTTMGTPDGGSRTIKAVYDKK